MKLIKIFENEDNRWILYCVLVLLVVVNAGFLAIYFDFVAPIAIIGVVAFMLMIFFFVALMENA